MSKDPFEELFGPAEPETEASQPVPARERLAFEQAERVKTSPLPTAKPPADKSQAAPSYAPNSPSAVAAREAGGDRASRAKPWIIVGIVTVVALIASIVVMNLARAGDEAAPSETTAAPQTSQPSTTSKPTTTDSDDEKTKDKDETETADKPPAVDVGQTGDMNVPLWGITAQISGKFGWPQYEIRGENLVLIGSPLIAQLPDSCAAMREQWGITRTAAGGFEVLKPAQSCAAAPELYDEIWGLTAAMVETIQPA